MATPPKMGEKTSKIGVVPPTVGVARPSYVRQNQVPIVTFPQNFIEIGPCKLYEVLFTERQRDGETEWTKNKPGGADGSPRTLYKYWQRP